LGKYGLVAVRAVKLLNMHEELSTAEAWEKAAIEVFSDKTTRHKKPCPRSTFLGICEMGLIYGVNEIRIKQRLRSEVNKNYARIAVELLEMDSNLSMHPRELWTEVLKEVEKTGNPPASHNYQMDVVTELWNNNLLIKKGVTTS